MQFHASHFNPPCKELTGKYKLIKMGRLSIFLFLLLIVTRAEAQFASISVEKHPTSMNVVQIDNRENSTLVFIEPKIRNYHPIHD